MPIIIEKKYKNITIRLEALYAGDDLCVLITGGDKSHIGAVSIYSKNDGVKTISLKHHKDYIIGEIFINEIKDISRGSISVSCGIHIDNITKSQIEDIYKLCNMVFEEFKKIY